MAVPLLRTLILYCAVICAVRLMGKRQIGELDPSELVVTILVSDLAAVPMQDLGIPLLSGLVPIATLVVLEIFLSFAALKSRRFRQLLNGQPAIIIRRGQLDIEKLREQPAGCAAAFAADELEQFFKLCGDLARYNPGDEQKILNMARTMMGGLAA